VEQLVEVGCWQCGELCPQTDETDPPLTTELGEAWFQEHRLTCPKADRPFTDSVHPL
jgi:hypothetical protein